jgi:hypothetical protein
MENLAAQTPPEGLIKQGGLRRSDTTITLVAGLRLSGLVAHKAFDQPMTVNRRAKLALTHF